MKIEAGYRDKDQQRAAELYWQAFGGKLGRVMGPQKKAMEFFCRVMRSDHAISAYSADDILLGLVGFKTAEGALAGGRFQDLRAIYGPIGASWRAVLLAALERDVENVAFLMDGIFVADGARGQGIGQKLLDAVRQEAAQRGYKCVRLDVIDTNTKAKSLYLRNDFVVVGTHSLGILRYVFGFSSAIQMIAPSRKRP